MWGSPPSTRSTARRILRTSSSTAASWRRGQPRWRSTRQTSSRCRGPPTGTCTRTRRTSSSPLPRHCRTPPPRPRLSGRRSQASACRTTSSSSRRSTIRKPPASPRSSATSGRPRSSAPPRKPGSCTRSTRASLRSSSRSPHATAPCASPRAPSRCSDRILRPRSSRRQRSCCRRRTTAYHASTAGKTRRGSMRSRRRRPRSRCGASGWDTSTTCTSPRLRCR